MDGRKLTSVLPTRPLPGCSYASARCRAPGQQWEPVPESTNSGEFRAVDLYLGSDGRSRENELNVSLLPPSPPPASSFPLSLSLSRWDIPTRTTLLPTLTNTVMLPTVNSSRAPTLLLYPTEPFPSSLQLLPSLLLSSTTISTQNQHLLLHPPSMNPPPKTKSPVVQGGREPNGTSSQLEVIQVQEVDPPRTEEQQAQGRGRVKRRRGAVVVITTMGRGGRVGRNQQGIGR